MFCDLVYFRVNKMSNYRPQIKELKIKRQKLECKMIALLKEINDVHVRLNNLEVKNAYRTLESRTQKN